MPNEYANQLRQMPTRNKLASLLEIIANAGTGGLAQMGGGLAYLPAAALGGDKAGQAVKAAVENAYTYQPRTEGAQSMLGMVGEYAAPLVNYGGQKVQQAADAAYQATGSPAVGAAVKTMPTLLQVVADRARVGKMAPPDRMEMTAYHGSPHDFDQFDISKIGTGEGAQVYGHGLYFAESPEVAAGYRDSLQFPRIDSPKDAVDRVADDLNYHRGNIESVRKIYKGMIEGGSDEAKALAKEKLDALPKAIEMYKGRLYTVDIPDEHVAKFLDWDKPLSEQPEILRILRDRLPDDVKASFDANVKSGISGANAYKNWVWGSGKGDAGASAALKAAGIPGIRYLDQGSRAGGKGTSNFVVFDDKLVKVLKKE